MCRWVLRMLCIDRGEFAFLRKLDVDCEEITKCRLVLSKVSIDISILPAALTDPIGELPTAEPADDMPPKGLLDMDAAALPLILGVLLLLLTLLIELMLLPAPSATYLSSRMLSIAEMGICKVKRCRYSSTVSERGTSLSGKMRIGCCAAPAEEKHGKTISVGRKMIRKSEIYRFPRTVMPVTSPKALDWVGSFHYINKQVTCYEFMYTINTHKENDIYLNMLLFNNMDSLKKIQSKLIDTRT